MKLKNKLTCVETSAFVVRDLTQLKIKTSFALLSSAT